MIAHALRWRLLGVGALVAACLSLAWAGAASAALSLDRSTDREITIDGDAHAIPGNLKPISYGGYQYFGSWDAADPRDGKIYLQVIRRRLTDGRLATLRFDGTTGTAYDLTVPMDGHNYVGLGLSPNDGRLHISWSLHTNDRRHRYLQSSSGCMSLRQEEFNLRNCTFTRREIQAGSEEEEMTYPTYFNDGRGRLYFSWRDGGSSHGDQFLNSYDDRGAWTARGTIIRGQATRSPVYRINGNNYQSEERGIYINEWKFDKNERLHALWVWRENFRLGLVGQHGLNYIYSDDYGREWNYEWGGRTGPIGTARTNPVEIADLADVEVVAVPPGYFLGAGGVELDSDNNPHFVAGTAERQIDNLAESNNLQQHFWRTNDGAWHSQFIEESADGILGLASTPGEIMFDQANTAYVIFARQYTEWAPYDSDLYTQLELPFENFIWQPDEGGGDGHIHLQVHSEVTCIEPIVPIRSSVSTTGISQVRMSMRNGTAARDLTISWRTPESGRTWIEQHFRGELTAESAYREYAFRMTDPNWSGRLTSLQICSAEGVTTGTQDFDWISFYNPTTRATAEVWNFARGFTLYGAQASAADNWGRWEIEELLPGVVDTFFDGYYFTDATRYADEKVVNFNILQQGAPGTEILSLREFDILNDDTIKDWRFDADAVGWTGINHIERFGWATDRERKTVGGTITGNDSAMISLTNLKVPIKRNRMIHVVMKNTSAATTARIWFRTERSRTWTTEKSKSFRINANSGYETYDIDMSRSEVRGWTEETLYQLELDPADDATTRGSFNVDRIYINDSTP